MSNKPVPGLRLAAKPTKLTAMNDPTKSNAPGLVRALGPMMAIAIVVGTVIGSGIFKKPQVVAQEVPEFGLAAMVWVLGGLLAFLGALALAEVAVLYPKAGGNYVFLRESFGPLAGFLWGWVEFWIIRGASLAALATIFSESLRDVLLNQAFQATFHLSVPTHWLDFWGLKWLTVTVIMLLALVNVRGVRWGGVLQLLITLVKVGSLLGIMALPFIASAVVDTGTTVPPPQPENLTPFWPDNWSLVNWGGFGTALLGVLFAYHGWMNVAPVAEEIRQPSRNLPLSLLGGTAIVVFLYLGANLAYYLIIPRDEMVHLKDTTVATDFSLRLLGPIGAAVASAAVMCSVFGALNGNLLVGPRLLYAMGEDRLAPRFLGAIHPRYHTPAFAILIMGSWAAILVLAGAALTRYGLPIVDLFGYSIDLNPPKNKPLFDILTDFAMFGSVTFETLAVASIFVFRWRMPDVERPYRCPGYPFVPLLYVLIIALVLANMFIHQRTEALIGVAFIVIGAGVYFQIRRRLGSHPSS
jgi:amino acid transporter